MAAAVRPVAKGRPDTEVIPAGWAAAHSAPVAGTMTATCTIRKPGGTRGAFDPDTGTYATEPYAPHYTGPCRVQVLPALGKDTVTADDQVTIVGYLVPVPLAGTEQTEPGHVVKITGLDDSDPAMVDTTLLNRELVVATIARGSLVVERDLYCTDQLG